MSNQASAADQAARKADKSAPADLKEHMLVMEKSDPDEFKRLSLGNYCERSESEIRNQKIYIIIVSIMYYSTTYDYTTKLQIKITK